MVNKKGLMRIVEATIAIILILGTLVIVSSQRKIQETKDFSEILPPLLDELSQNLTLREEILEDIDENLSEEKVAKAIGPHINPSLNYSVEICNLEEPCYLSPYPNTEQDIFTRERVISASIKNESFSPKKIKVFLWKKT